MPLPGWIELATILTTGAVPFALFIWWFGAQSRDYEA